MRDAGEKRVAGLLGDETRECATAQRVTGVDGGALQQQAVAARVEWFRQMRLQSAIFAMQINVRAGTPDGSTVVADAEKIFEFLTKEDVH